MGSYQRALALGADLVIHSATKYLASHNGVLAGAPPWSSAMHGPADLRVSASLAHTSARWRWALAWSSTAPQSFLPL